MRKIRKLKLGEAEANDWLGTTPEQRVAAVWDLTRTAYALKGEDPGDARLRRDVLRIVRRGGQVHPRRRPIASTS